MRTIASPRPDAPARRLPTGSDFPDGLDALLFGPRAPGNDPPTADAGALEDAPLAASDLAAFRAAAVPELEAAVERLLARGHHASLADHLTHQEPSVLVRFLPNQGPLTAFGSTARESARFELRLAADLDGGAQVVAGFSHGTPDAPFTLLSRTRLSAVRSDWVRHRFVDFVQRVLGPG
jgi:hypothetical protein